MRGDSVLTDKDERYIVPKKRRGIATAVIIDGEGNEIFQIVPTRWARLISVGYALLLFITIILAGLIYYNNVQINTLENKVDYESNTSNK